MDPAPVHWETDSFFVTGGTMRPTAPSYVDRQADTDLYRALMRSEYCYVLDTRQMGKSSLVARAANRLRGERSASVATVDLQRCGQSLTIDQWYEAQVNQIAEDLGMEDEVEEFWEAHENIGPLDRWMRTIRQVILRNVSGPLIIFVDEIDFVRSLPFPTDEYFGGIRGFFNERAADPELRRLTFCLVGVAVPNDLIRDEQLTPFNIGRRIDLADLSESETVTGFARGFSRPSEALLKRVWYWTEGHPYLTQRLAEAVAEDHAATNPKDVDRICKMLYLTAGAREQNDNLRFVASRLLDPRIDAATVVDLYRKVLNGEAIKDDRANPFIDALRLSGIVRIAGTEFQVRNQVYREVFDESWITQNIGDREVIRQTEAYTRGRQRATRIAGIVIVLGIFLGLIGWLTFSTFQNRKLSDQYKRAAKAEALARSRAAEAEQSRQQAEQERQQADEQRRQADEQRRQAQSNEARALTAEAEAKRQAQLADRQTGLAVKARNDAQQAEQRANNSAKAAETARENEAGQRLIAQGAAEEARKLSQELAKQNAISTPLRLAARSEMDRPLPDLTVASTLVGIDALGKRWSLDTYSPVLQSLALLPHDPKEVKWPTPLSGNFNRTPVPGTFTGTAGQGNQNICVVQLSPAKETCVTLPAGRLRNSANFLISTISSGRSSETRYWDIWNGTAFQRLGITLPDDFVWSPSGKLVATSDPSGAVVVQEFPSGWEVARLVQKSRGPKPVTGKLKAFQFSPDDQYLIAYDANADAGNHIIWDLTSRLKVAMYRGAGNSSQFSSNGRSMRVNNSIYFIPSFPSRDQEKPPQLSPLFASLSGSAEFSTDGRNLIVFNSDSQYLYRLPNAAPIPFPATPGTAQVVFSPNGQSVAFVTNKYARIFETGRLQETARVMQTGIRAAAFSDDFNLITTSLTGATEWNVEGWHYSERLPLRSSAASLVAFSPSGEYVVTGRGAFAGSATDFSLTVMDISNSPAKEMQYLLAPRTFTSLRFSANSSVLAASSGNRVSVISLTAGQARNPIEWTSPLTDISPDGGLFILQNGEVRDSQNARVGSLGTLPGRPVFSFPDASTLAWSSAGQLYRTALPQLPSPKGVPPLPNGTFTAAATSSDKRYQLLEGTLNRGVIGFALWDSKQPTTTLVPFSLDQQVYASLSRSAKYVFLDYVYKDRWEIRNISTGAVVAGMEKNVSNASVRFSPDERYAAVPFAGEVQVFDLSTGKPNCLIPVANRPRSPIGFGDGGRLLTVTDAKIEFWNVSDCKPAQYSALEGRQPIRAPEISPDGKFLAWFEGISNQSATGDQLQITDTRSHTSFSVSVPDAISAVAFSADGRVLMAGARDGTVKSFDMSRKALVEGKESRAELRAPAHDFDVTSLAITPDGRYSVSASGPMLRLWETNSGELKSSVPFRNRVMTVSIDQGGRFLAVGLRDGQVQVRRLPGLDIAQRLDFHEQVFTLSFSADGKFLAATGTAGRRVIWDATRSWAEIPLGAAIPQLSAGMFAATGHRYAAFSPTLVEVWNGDEPRQIKPDGIGTIGAIAFSPDGKYLFIGGSSGVRIWDLTEHAEVGRIGESLVVRGLGLSPDGKYLAVTYANSSGIRTVWKKEDLIEEACRRLGEGQNKLKDEEIKRYFLAGEKYDDFCHSPVSSQTARR